MYREKDSRPATTSSGRKLLAAALQSGPFSLDQLVPVLAIMSDIILRHQVPFDFQLRMESSESVTGLLCLLRDRGDGPDLMPGLRNLRRDLTHTDAGPPGMGWNRSNPQDPQGLLPGPDRS